MPVFKNTPVKATPQTVNQYVIDVNGKNFKPITNETSKPVTFMGKLYIPVQREKNSVEDKKDMAELRSRKIIEVGEILEPVMEGVEIKSMARSIKRTYNNKI